MIFDYMKSEHSKNLPYVRIVEAELENFKSVKHGKITFDCGKKKVPYNTKSDILGIYGQNGSGKTSFIDALEILHILMMGDSIPEEFSYCVAAGAEYARLSFSFDFQYRDGKIRKVNYEFKLAVINDFEKNEKFEGDSKYYEIKQRPKKKIKVFDEVVSASGDYYGKKIKYQSILDASTNMIPFGPASKLKFYLKTENDLETKTNLLVNKKLAAEKSMSFIFMDETLAILSKIDIQSEYYETILELSYFATFYFLVIGPRASWWIRFGAGVPISSKNGYMVIGNEGMTITSSEFCEVMEKEIADSNLVLGSLIPGLSIKVKRLGPTLLQNGSQGEIIEVVSVRGDTEIPLNAESDGILKLVTVMFALIRAFNDASFTLAIDEFDAGVFEYLLGELLENFEVYGKGQFIFTSHNLRPLEVINKDYLLFTTTNPENRYVKLKNIGNSNNLRDRYYHEILLGEQDEELYAQTKSHRIVQAFRKAGMNYGK